MDTLEDAQRSLLLFLSHNGKCDPRSPMLKSGLGKRDYKDLLQGCIDDGWVRVAKHEPIARENLVGMFPSEWEITLAGRSALVRLSTTGETSTRSSSITVNVHESQIAVGDANRQAKRAKR